MISLPAPTESPTAVCVAFSGGLDSSVLLHWLAHLPPAQCPQLRAIHVHHGLQADADAWSEHCLRVCDALGVPLDVQRVQVQRNSGEGLEAAARAARHAVFARQLRPGEWLATAHHRDDQAETFLLRALRASGPDGLAAMRPLRDYAQGWLWRPLLALPRQQLLAYAQAHGLDWIEDPSNIDISHDRNFLRHQVMPLLRQRWPQAEAAFARAAALNAGAVALLTEEDALALAGVRTADPDALSVAALSVLPAARRARILRQWIGSLQLPPLPAEGIVRIEADLLATRADAQARFAWNGTVLQRWRDLLHAGPWREPLPSRWRTPWQGQTPLLLPDSGRVMLLSTNPDAWPVTDFVVHARQGGERIRLPGRDHSQAVKTLLQAHAVPPWQRAHLPLLSTPEGELLAIGDMLFSARFSDWLDTHSLTYRWLPPPHTTLPG